IELKKRDNLENSPKLTEKYGQLERLINELINRSLPESTVDFINQRIEEINSSSFLDKDFKKLLKKKQTEITKFIEKEHKLVPKNYYRNLWFVLGMSAFGIPIGIAIGMSIGNIGLLAVGLPIGIAIGASVGAEMDKKAFREGRQLNIELKNSR